MTTDPKTVAAPADTVEMTPPTGDVAPVDAAAAAAAAAVAAEPEAPTKKPRKSRSARSGSRSASSRGVGGGKKGSSRSQSRKSKSVDRKAKAKRAVGATRSGGKKISNGATKRGAESKRSKSSASASASASASPSDASLKEIKPDLVTQDDKPVFSSDMVFVPPIEFTTKMGMRKIQYVRCFRDAIQDAVLAQGQKPEDVPRIRRSTIQLNRHLDQENLISLLQEAGLHAQHAGRHTTKPEDLQLGIALTRSREGDHRDSDMLTRSYMTKRGERAKAKWLNAKREVEKKNVELLAEGKPLLPLPVLKTKKSKKPKAVRPKKDDAATAGSAAPDASANAAANTETQDVAMASASASASASGSGDAAAAKKKRVPPRKKKQTEAEALGAAIPVAVDVSA